MSATEGSTGEEVAPHDAARARAHTLGLGALTARVRSARARTVGRLGSRPWRVLVDLLVNVALLAVLWIAYSSVRRLTADEKPLAVLNAWKIVDFQNAIGLPNEARLQTFVIGHETVIRALNSFYMWGHFSITGAFLAWVFFARRHQFPVVREAMIFLTAAGLLIHTVFPLAPPRLLPSFVDTGALFGPSPYSLDASAAANQIAAMPSLHVGWSLVVAISMITLTKGRYRFLFLIHPLLTTSAVILTANHYWTDAIVAVLLVAGAWEFSARLAHHELLQPLQSRADETGTDETGTDETSDHDQLLENRSSPHDLEACGVER